MRPKFNIGDIVYNKVERRGSYEPSVARLYEKMEVDGVRRSNSSFIYICGFDGYEFKEDELMSKEEYIEYINSTSDRDEYSIPAKKFIMDVKNYKFYLINVLGLPMIACDGILSDDVIVDLQKLSVKPLYFYATETWNDGVICKILPKPNGINNDYTLISLYNLGDNSCETLNHEILVTSKNYAFNHSVNLTLEEYVDTAGHILWGMETQLM